MVSIQHPWLDLSNVTPNTFEWKQKMKGNQFIKQDTIGKSLSKLVQKVVYTPDEEKRQMNRDEKAFNVNRPEGLLPYSARPSLASPSNDNFVTHKVLLEDFSLDEDYLDYTMNPEDIFSEEHRERINTITYQWYFDEYSGIYRQSSCNLHQSMPSFPNPDMFSPNARTARLKQKANKLPSRNKSRFLVHNSPTLTSQSSIGLNNSSQTVVAEDIEDEWPIPTSIKQVHQLRKKAQATKDCRKQLKLCRKLMDTAFRREVAHGTESWYPGTRHGDMRGQQQELRKKKKRDLMLDEVLVLEAQKMLKRLAMGDGGMGRGTDSEAQFLLANCYGTGGLGLSVDREKAFSLYIHASKQDHVESTYRAGVCYELGIGTDKDYSRAVTFYRKAATHLHVASMYKLTIILLRGFCGQTINVREAMTWLQRAVTLANAENPHALYLLAMFHISSDFCDSNLIVMDPSYGIELLHESALLNYVPSQVKLGELYEQGGAVDVDDVQSIYWYTRAAEKGNADAALALSSWYLTGSPGILKQSDQEAYLWARKAASCRNADRWTAAKAYFLVGVYIDKGVGINEASKDDAKVWFRRSAALGHRGAIKILGNESSQSVGSNQADM